MKEQESAYITSDKPRHPHLRQIPGIHEQDLKKLQKKEAEYDASWKKRGGAGAHMNCARKWDRIEAQVQRYGWDVFAAIRASHGPDGFLDDIQDLRRYLTLIEAECIEQGWIPAAQMEDTNWEKLNAAAQQGMTIRTDKHVHVSLGKVTYKSDNPDDVDESGMAGDPGVPGEADPRAMRARRKQLHTDEDRAEQKCSSCFHERFQHTLLAGACQKEGCRCKEFTYAPADVEIPLSR